MRRAAASPALLLPALVVVLATPACAPAPDQARGSTAADTVAAPRDSLAARGPDSVSVWFTLERQDHDSAGRACLDRGLEIRRGARRIAVPLLYTEEAPRLVDDTTMEAVLYRSCVPLDRYRVDLRTGQPVPVRAP